MSVNTPRAQPPMQPPIIWSIAGHDSSGGAGLSADQRGADALGVHLCPVVACITAQHSQGVQAAYPVTAAQLEAQCQALAGDLPPVAIKTGLLGDAQLVQAVARWVDRLRQHHPGLALIVDPVLGATAGGAAFADDAVLQAYRQALLPRATVITPNRAEARRLLGEQATHQGADDEVPMLAARLRALGAQGVVITGGDVSQSGWSMDWLDLPHAQGWLCAPRVDTAHHHGSGCTFASALAAAMAMGHVSADATVLAKMVTHQALRDGHAAGQGAGPVKAGCTRALGPLPWLGLHDALPWRMQHGQAAGSSLFRPFEPPADGLYGILPDGPMLSAAAQAGMGCLQLRHKAREGVEAHIDMATGACSQHGGTLFINDHWQLALAALPDAGAPSLKLGIHLGHEDLLALDEAGVARLLSQRHRILLGLSSHSLWELARAAGCGASLIACGPVLPTRTKDMPWRPQGMDNLRWWIQHSPAPVVAIGGLLTPEDISQAAACRPAAICVVRALGQTPDGVAHALPALREAVRCGRSQTQALAEIPSEATMEALPHPVL